MRWAGEEEQAVRSSPASQIGRTPSPRAAALAPSWHSSPESQVRCSPGTCRGRSLRALGAGSRHTGRCPRWGCRVCLHVWLHSFEPLGSCEHCGDPVGDSPCPPPRVSVLRRLHGSTLFGQGDSSPRRGPRRGQSLLPVSILRSGDCLRELPARRVQNLDQRAAAQSQEGRVLAT